MKLWLAPATCLNASMLWERFTPADHPSTADIAIAWKADLEGIDPAQVIMCQSEPPVSSDRKRMYGDFARYHTVVRFDPQGPNELPFSNRWPHLVPYKPWLHRRYPLPILKLDPVGNGIYFAGKRRTIDTESYGYPIIYGLRARIAQGLQGALGGTCHGEGWSESTKQAPEGWHHAKLQEIHDLHPDFVLAIENTRMPGYISEKLWDGLLTDRVTLYLGAPDIEKHVDPRGYLDLSPYVTGHEIDMPRLIRDLRAYLAIPDAYRETIHVARQILGDAAYQQQAAIDDLTCRLIARIQEQPT